MNSAKCIYVTDIATTEKSWMDENWVS